MFYQIGSYMNGFEPVRWRWSHFRHHGYTYFDDPLDFEIAIRKPADVFYFFSLFIPFFDFVNEFTSDSTGDSTGESTRDSTGESTVDCTGKF